MLLLRLIQNEWMKIVHKRSTWVMVAILLIAVGGVGFIYTLLLSENDPTHHYWGFVHSAIDLTSMITVFAVIIAAGAIAGEFTQGTIKMLLVRPVTRSMILVSKYVATLLFVLMMLIILVVVAMVVAMVMYGIGDIRNVNALLYHTEGTVLVPLQTAAVLALNSVDIIIMVSFAFMIATVFRSSSLAIGLVLFCLFTGSNVVLWLSQYDWVQFVLFAHMNLRGHLTGMPILEDVGLVFSLCMLAMYWFLFHLIAWWTFNKRDVAV